MKSDYLSKCQIQPIVHQPMCASLPIHQPRTANLLTPLAPCLQNPGRGIYHTKKLLNMHLSLAASAPYVLQQTISLRQSVQGIIALAHRSYETAECVNLALAGESAVLVNLSYGDLDGGMVLGLDDAVGGAALSWDVTGNPRSVSILIVRREIRLSHCDSWGTYRSTSSPLSFSILTDFWR